MIARWWRMPIRFLRDSHARLILTVVALASGVALVLAMDLVTGAMRTAFAEIIDTMAGRASLQVSAASGGLLPEEVANGIAGVAAVERAVPVVSAAAFLTDGSGEVLSVLGIDLTNERAVRVYEARDDLGEVIDDPLVFLSQPDSVVVTRSFAERKGLGDGDRIELDTPTGRRSFTIRGVLEPEGIARVYGGNLLLMDLFAAEAAFTRPGFVTRIDVVLDRDADQESVARKIAASLPPGLRLDTPVQRKLDLSRVLSSFEVLLRGASLIALVAAALITFNRLTSVFERRTWQLGMIVATGFTRRAAFTELLAESLLLGAAGVVLGIPLGIGLAHLLLPAVATAAALNFKVLPAEGGLTLQASSFVLAAALGLGASLAAAIVPARRTVRRAAAELLRARDVEQPGLSRRGRLGAITLLALGIAAAVAAQAWTGSFGYGLVASVLVAALGAAAARPLLTPVFLAARPLVRLVAGRAWRLVAGALAASPRRLALTAATLGVGLGTVFWLWILAASFERSVVSALSRAIRADLIVSSPNQSAGFLEAPVEGALVERVRAVPGVGAVAGWRALEVPYEGDSIGISAYDPSYFLDTRFGEWPLLGGDADEVWPAVAAGEAVVVSTSFAFNFGLGVGDELTLATPTGPLTLPIAGLTVDFVSPRGTVEISRDLFVARWRDAQVTRVFLQVAPDAHVADVRAAIAGELGTTHTLRVLSSGELLDYFVAQVRRAFAVLSVLAAAVLLVVLIGMADSLAAGVLERTRELGAMRALGVPRGSVRRVVLAEGLVVSLLGLLLAAGIALALGVLWTGSTFAYLLGWSLELNLPWAELALAALLAAAICLLAAWIPARRAARLEPAQALRYE